MTRNVKIGLISGSVIVFGLLAWFAVQFFSHSSDAHLKVIPKNAAAVLKIDIKALAAKADLAKLLQKPAFKKNNSGKVSLSQLISNPFGSGIDPLENIYGFLSKNEMNIVSAIVFKVADENELETFVKNLGISENISEESGIFYAAIDEHRCISWNDEVGMVISVSGGDVKMISQKYLQMEKSGSILDVANYKTFSEKSFDIGLFLDNKILSQMSGAENALTTLGFVDGHGELLLSFENDKIVTSYTNYSAFSGSIPVLNKKGPSQNHFDAIAPKTPLVYLGLSADVNQIFNAIGTDPQMKQNLEDLQVYINVPGSELKKLFTGDASIAFTDFIDISSYDPRVGAQVTMNMNYSRSGSDFDRSDFSLNAPLAYINLGVTDDAKANGILDELGLMKMEKFYAMPGLNFIVYAVAKDGHLLITNDYFAADSLSKTGKFASNLPTGISKTNPFAIWADLNQSHFPIALTESMKNDFGEETVNFYLDVLKPFKSVRMESTASGSQFEISIQPGEGNSLYRLLSYYGTLVN